MIKRTIHRSVSCSFLCVLLGMAAAPAPAEDEKPAAAPMPKPAASTQLIDRNHHLGPGDVIQITVAGLEELDRTVRLFADGTFDFPVLGTVQAAGLTASELVERLTEGMKKELRRPRITVTLKEAYVPPQPERKEVKLPRVTVLGAAAKTGQIDLPEPKPLRTLLAEISPTDRADLSKIRVRYPDGSARTADFSKFNLTGHAADDVLIRGGEELILLERPPEPLKGADYVRIAGQVVNPTQYELKPGMTLEDLIITAGKLTPLADVQRLELRRKGAEIRTIDLLEQQKLGIAGLIRLLAGDELFIPEQQNVVILLGAVSTPGPQALEPGKTIRDFFVNGGANAGALNPAVVNLKEVELIRQGEPATRVDLRAVLKNPAHKQNLVLRTGDVVFLPPSRQSSQPRGVLGFLQQLGPLGFLFSVL